MCVWLSVSVVLCVIVCVVVFSDEDETDISSSLFIKMSNLFDYNKFIMSLFNPYLTPVLREPFCESWVFASTHGTCDVQFLYFSGIKDLTVRQLSQSRDKYPKTKAK